MQAAVSKFDRLALDAESQVVDGYTYSSFFGSRPLPLQYWRRCQDRQLPLRVCASAFKPKWCVFPESPAQFRTGIAARETTYYQFSVEPQSYLIGWDIFSQTLASSASLFGQMAITLRDSCTDMPLFKLPLSEVCMQANIPSLNAGERSFMSIPMICPLLISAPGLLHLEFMNTGYNPLVAYASLAPALAQAQIALFFMEPVSEREGED